MRRHSVVLLALVSLAPAVRAQQARTPRPVTVEDYARAERNMGYNTTNLVSGGAVRPNWLAGDRFWYRNVTNDGAEYVLVDPARRTRVRAFDHTRMAAALSRVA